MTLTSMGIVVKYYMGDIQIKYKFYITSIRIGGCKLSEATFFKNQSDVAKAINKLVDDYWMQKYNDKEFVESIGNIIDNNKDKIFKYGSYTKMILQRCGIRRLDLIERVLKMEIKK